jgi:threonine/homoserine/homoserine lactone efflux protein
MEFIADLLKGIMLGFLIAAPVGPIGLLCINRTINKGRLSGFLSGLGAATADACYGAVAAFGLVVVSGFLSDHQFFLRLVGGIFLLYLGADAFFSEPQEAAREGRGSASDYLSTLFLTLMNPMTILSFVALFASTSFALSGSIVSATVLTAGVFLGSVLWWFILSFGIAWIQSRYNFPFRIVNHISGFAIMGFALFLLSKLI